MTGKNGRTLRLDAVIRVSQRGGREDKHLRSPDQQQEIIQAWVVSNGAKIADEHVNVGLSGKTMDRADIAVALERIRGGQTDGLIVAYASRLSRARVDEALAFKAAVENAGGRLVVCDLGGIDLDSAAGELVFTNMVAFARYQWRETAERYETSRRDAIKAGKAIGGAPFGYRFRDPTKRPTGRGVLDSRLVPDEAMANLIPELFERKAAGASWLELARWLDRVAPKPGDRHWSRQTVIGMIRSRTYLGEVRSGLHTREGAHEPLVPPALWRRAQNEPGHRTPRGTYLLSGLVRCSGCGRSMRASSGGLKKPAVFVCITPECELRYSTVVVEKVDTEVMAQFFARLDTFHAEAVADGELAEAVAEVERLTGEVERLAMVAPSHPAAVAAHQRALRGAEEALNATEDHRDSVLAAKAQTGPAAREIRADWPSLDLDERREILRATIDAVLVRRANKQGAGSIMSERIRVLFHGEAPDDLMVRRGRVRSWTWTDEPGSVRAAA